MTRVRLDPDHALPVMRSMPPALRTRLRKALRDIPDDPSGRSTGLNVKRLRNPGDPPAFRLRIGDGGPAGSCATTPSTVAVVAGYRREKLQRYSEDGRRFGCRITYVFQDLLPGTAHALAQVDFRATTETIEGRGPLAPQAVGPSKVEYITVFGNT